MTSDSHATTSPRRPSSPLAALYDPNRAGFTAVNGEANKSMSFRPLDDGDSHDVVASPKGKERMLETQANGEAQSDYTHRGRSTSASVIKDNSPPNEEPRAERSEQPASMTPLSQRDTSTPSSASQEAGHVEPEDQHSISRWDPHDVRPETSRELQSSLNAHLSSTRARSPEVPDSSNKRPSTETSQPAAKRKREFAHRTKTGCHTCRDRKKKCDEKKPVCDNCARGGFPCTGYGPKPPGYKPQRRHGKSNVDIRAKAGGEYQSMMNGPTAGPSSEQHWPAPPRGYPYESPQYHHPPPHRGPPPPMHGYNGPPHEQRDNWHYPQYNEAPHIHLQQNKLPHSDYGQIMPPFGRDYSRNGPPPDVFGPPQYRASTVAGSLHGGHDSGHSSLSRRSSHLPPIVSQEPPPSQRDNMIIGRPYQHYKDTTLISDRMDCKTAVDLYNRAALPSEGLSQDERGSRFMAILNPALRKSRNATDSPQVIGRAGKCGSRTIVEAPFSCDYGYNLIIGDDVVIESGCYMQDPCEIVIGDRSTIGQNVTFCGMTASVGCPSGQRSGSQGYYLGGAITIESDCFIGANVTILPYRTVGKGAVVGAGSIITRDVKPYTVVAGNPAKEIRPVGDQAADRRHRADIQEQNEAMKRAMKDKRFNSNWNPESIHNLIR